MLQNNSALAQLKQQIRDNTPRATGVVKGTEKGFGFLETDDGQSLFIPPPAMKQVMHGDRIEAVIHEADERKSVAPDSLIEAGLDRFIGRVQKREGKLSVVPDHPSIKTAIRARVHRQLDEAAMNEGDWVVARLLRHPLRADDRSFFCQIDEVIATSSDPSVPWRVTLARHALEQASPSGAEQWPQLEESLTRTDLSDQPFFTIDSASTTDMDDALYIEARSEGGYRLTVAIADPTAYIAVDDAVDREARQRAFTVYLPGRNVTMLPEALADDLCSLKQDADRLALAATLEVDSDGTITETRFFTATVRSHARLTYEQVSDWLEAQGEWQPESESIAQQLRQLEGFTRARQQWREQHALVFPDRPDYVFKLDEAGNVLDIVAEPRRIAHRMIEEAMIAANLSCADFLKRHVGHGIYNVHQGFTEERADQAVQLLAAQSIEASREQLMGVEGYRTLRRTLDTHNNAWLDARLRRLQGFAGVSSEPGPHFGMGVPAYATWTSPIRKYGDMFNHRLIKQVLREETPSTAATETLTEHLGERRRLNRLAERDVKDWLYVRYLSEAAREGRGFAAEIVDIRRGGLRVRLAANGASAFVPASTLTSDRDQLSIDEREGLIHIGGELRYRLGDPLNVVLSEAREETRSLVARPAE
ncbi:exoribonuclease II [Kushneria phosphatilytica]|uniref:Exoribonuclease 2 n=1 Tax=Kushneria phosphatilytica TaxID=657387 RepID=A0A5C1A3S7_9GAMM|nr:exoribonuclease II [Kushneria phosphatilytica]QEL12754.1 exoribonuclease II [Kushneria phosphatilytica]